MQKNIVYTYNEIYHAIENDKDRLVIFNELVANKEDYATLLNDVDVRKNRYSSLMSLVVEGGHIDLIEGLLPIIDFSQYVRPSKNIITYCEYFNVKNKDELVNLFIDYIIKKEIPSNCWIDGMIRSDQKMSFIERDMVTLSNPSYFNLLMYSDKEVEFCDLTQYVNEILTSSGGIAHLLLIQNKLKTTVSDFSLCKNNLTKMIYIMDFTKDLEPMMFDSFNNRTNQSSQELSERWGAKIESEILNREINMSTIISNKKVASKI